MIKDIHSVGLTVGDLEASIAFYCTEESYELIENFDLVNNSATQAMYGVSQPEGKGALLRGPGGFLELTQLNGSRDAKTDSRRVYDAGIRHVCIRTRDANELFDHFDNAGATWHARPTDLGTGLDYAYLRDLEGNLFEIEGLPMMPPGVMKPWFDHVALATPDINRLITFYEALTETEGSRRESYGPGKKFDTVTGLDGAVFEGAWILFGVSRIELWQYDNPKTKPKQDRSADEIGWSHLCLEVDDLDAERTRLSKLGVEFLTDNQTGLMGRSTVIRDVDGNFIKLLQVSSDRPDLSVDNLSSRPILNQIREVSEGPRRK